MTRAGSRRSRGRARRKAAPRRAWLTMLALAALVAALAAWRWHSMRQPGTWQRVFATREGQIGDITATQMVIRPESMFVALPHPRALGRMVEVRYKERVVVVPVLDVGPWNIDDAYWERDQRPASERGKGFFRRPVNRAGIDLSDAVFAALGLPDNDEVTWRFVHRDYVAWPRL